MKLSLPQKIPGCVPVATFLLLRIFSLKQSNGGKPLGGSEKFGLSIKRCKLEIETMVINTVYYSLKVNSASI